MVKNLFTFLVLVSSTTSFACPDAGKISLNERETTALTFSVYNPSLRVSRGYKLISLETKLSGIAGAEFHPVCLTQVSAEGRNKPYCANIEELTIRDGIRDVRGSVKNLYSGNVYSFTLDEVRFDVDQPLMRGGCGRAVALRK